MSWFISFEGIEGSGKTTQIKRLAEKLGAQGLPVLLTREPGGCPIADQVRGILLHPDNANLVSRAELLLYAAARAQHVEEVILPALKEGRVVLCDRFCDATLAYQGYARGLDLRLVRELNQLAAGDCQPDLTILLDMPANLGLHRAQERNISTQNLTEGRFEQESLKFHQKVRQGYLKLADSAPHRFKIIDAADTVERIAERIATAVFDFIDAGKRN